MIAYYPQKRDKLFAFFFLKAAEFRRTVGFVILQHFRVQGDCQFYAMVCFSDQSGMV